MPARISRRGLIPPRPPAPSCARRAKSRRGRSRRGRDARSVREVAAEHVGRVRRGIVRLFARPMGAKVGHDDATTPRRNRAAVPNLIQLTASLETDRGERRADAPRPFTPCEPYAVARFEKLRFDRRCRLCPCGGRLGRTLQRGPQPLLLHPPLRHLDAVLPEKRFALEHQSRHAPMTGHLERDLVGGEFIVERLCVGFSGFGVAVRRDQVRRAAPRLPDDRPDASRARRPRSAAPPRAQNAEALAAPRRCLARSGEAIDIGLLGGDRRASPMSCTIGSGRGGPKGMPWNCATRIMSRIV